MPDDVIEVRGGCYFENQNIQKSVSLVGVSGGYRMPEINGSDHDSVVVINIDNVNISGFKQIFANRFIDNSVNIGDSGENQWCKTASQPGGILSAILGYLGAGENGPPRRNYYHNYDEGE